MTLLTVCVCILAVTSVAVLSVVFIRRTEHSKSDQLLLLLCETGEKNLNYYFNSVQKSVEKVASYAEKDLDGLEDEQLAQHVERVRETFDVVASKTNGVLTYYYRIDPAVSEKVKGFWYIDLEGDDFEEHEVTDITLYDTEDTSRLVWFTVPKHVRKPIWIPPYITENLNKRVISYNVPVSWKGQFVGVIGIEVDYSTMAKQVDSIRLFQNGYAFLNDAEGKIFYHPRIDVTKLTDETMPETPEGLLAKTTFLRYSFEGVEKAAAWLPLTNGMRLNVTVPVAETEGDWQKLIWNVLIVAAEVMVVSCLITLFYTRRITKPLEALTEAAKQIELGNFDFSLDYDTDDEVGRLTNTFKRLAGHVKDQFSDLNKRAYVDSLTSVRNKGAYSTFLDELQTRLNENGGHLAFAIGMFDCDNLKTINDRYGHENGDLYLKASSRLICRVFQHSPVFRIGGDEFSVILQGDDYRDRELLTRRFEEEMAATCAATKKEWEQVRVAMGIAVYDPQRDRSVNDVIRRADEAMYRNKRIRKTER